MKHDEFENIRNEYYRLRNWDKETGYQTKELMESMDLSDVAAELNSMGLLNIETLNGNKPEFTQTDLISTHEVHPE